MIKVIKHGQTEFTHTCSRCGCEFTYEYEDIITNSYGGLAVNAIGTSYVKCPDCGNTCYVKTNIGWPWPTPGEPIPCNTPSEANKIDPCKDCDWMKKLLSGITYVGDIPCTWCNKGPYKVTCVDSGSTTSSSKLQIYNTNQSVNDDLVTAGTPSNKAVCSCGGHCKDK